MAKDKNSEADDSKLKKEGPTKYELNLPCDLKPSELNEEAMRLNELLSQKDALIMEAKSHSDRFKGLIGDVDASVVEVRQRINSKTILKPVMVVEVPNYESRMIEIHRTDKKIGNPDRVWRKREMNLFEQAAQDDSKADEANYLADAITEEVKEKKSRKRKPKADSETEGDQIADTSKVVNLADKKKAKANGNGKHKQEEPIPDESAATDEDSSWVPGSSLAKAKAWEGQ